MNYSLFLSVLLGVIVFACAFASSNIAKIEERPVFQPESYAFSIWLLIFVLALCNAILFYTEKIPLSTHILYVLTFALLSVWAPLFNREKYFASSILLLIASILGIATVVSYSPPLTLINLWITSGVDILVGWTIVATALGMVIAKSLPNKRFILTIAVVVVSAFSIILKRPFLTVPLLWASLANKEYTVEIRLAVGIGILSIVTSSLYSTLDLS